MKRPPITAALSSLASKGAWWLVAWLAALLALPVLSLALSWFPWPSVGGTTTDTLSHLFSTVLPSYVGHSLVLAVGVGLGVALVGGVTASAVTLFEFPGRRHFEWMLLLPLSMPAYVLAYAYTDTLQTSGPLQTALRSSLGLRGALWPDVRSLWGAVILFILCLYPYVYLLTRAALAERGLHLMETARLLGANTRRRIFGVALPMARPAVAAGTALALMETLADYGVGSYFGLTTFTTGIYQAWLSMGDRMAAARLACMLLLLVGLLMWLESRSQQRLRYAVARPLQAASSEARPIPLRGMRRWAAWLACGLPIAFGFVLPVIALLRLALSVEPIEPGVSGMPWERFLPWAWNSFRLAIMAAFLATALATALAFAKRQRWTTATMLHRLLGLGYAVPGAVLAVGILLPAGLIQTHWPSWPVAAWMTASTLGLLLAYLVRFSGVALQAVDAGYARVSIKVDESARLLGVRGWSVWPLVHGPLMHRALGTGVLLVFVDVMKELPATLVLRPFNTDTLAVMANHLARDERLAEASWPSLAIVLVGLLPVLVLSRASKVSSSKG